MGKGMIKSEIANDLFHKITTDIRTEALYIFEILPIVLSMKNSGAREKFLKESGLDLYYIEELEREYFENKGLDMSLMEKIQKPLE